MLGAQRTPYLQPGEWQLGLGYRWLRSDRHFRGTIEQVERERLRNNVVNKQQLLDLAATYQIDRRLNLTLSVPYLTYGSWSIPLPIRPVPGERQVQSAEGVGDISLTARYWLLRPERHPEENIALGFGLKFPTGNPGARDEFGDITGGNLAVKPVDMSIQPGDGGFGFTLDLQAFKTAGSLALFASGVYLFNPRNTNDTLSIASVLRGPQNVAPHLRYNSVPDQFLARIGVAHAVPRVKGLSASLAARIEGVPPRDVFGGNDGFRRPGHSIFIEPGLTWVRGSTVFSLSVPVATSRIRVNNARNEPGDATFADYFFLFNVSHRFGK